MRRVVLKSPVRENCTPGSVRGALGNQRPYLANRRASPGMTALEPAQPGRRPAARRGGGMVKLGPVGDGGERTWGKSRKSENREPKSGRWDG